MPVGTPDQFGRNPARGVPSTSRGRRTTAGSHRISSLSSGRSGAFTAKGRPLSDFPKMFRHLVDASEGLPAVLVRPVAEAIRDETARQGRRYKLRGHKGGKFPLEAKTERPRGQAGAASKRSMFVVGVPPGFWRIVEEGSNRHLIAGRYRRSSGNRFTAKGAHGAFVRGAMRGDDDAFGRMGTPVNVLGHAKGTSNEGWAQYVDHPGHGPIGRPWRRAMLASQNILDDYTEAYSSHEFARAFFR